MGREDQIQLEFPAAPEYGRVARIAAAHIAQRRGFSMTEIDDLRLVMDEAAVMLLGPGSGGDRLVVEYSVGADSVAIDARVMAGSKTPIPVEAVERFQELVGDLIDTYTINRDERQLVLTKYRLA